MATVASEATDVAGAIQHIFDVIQRDPNNNITIYFDGWRYGFGAPTVLRSMAQTLQSMKSPPPRLCFGRIIYIDCSRWVSRRDMQKKIAQELGLDHETLAMFEEKDKEDDFNGVDLRSRDAIRNAAALINRNLSESRFLMAFIDGSDDEVDLGRLGVPEISGDCVIIWAYSARLVAMMDHRFSCHYQETVKKKLRHTDVWLCNNMASHLTSSQFIALFHEVAANIVARHPEFARGMDLSTTVVDCCLYGLLLQYHMCDLWAYAPNYWICDGIIQGDRAWEISRALHSDISFDCKASIIDEMFTRLKEDPKTPFLVVYDGDDVYGGRAYRWISVTSKNNKVNEGLQTIFARASSIFLASETMDNPCELPNGLFKQCSNLGVLDLSCCAFSFISPPFLHCHTIRFLGLDHCTDNNDRASEHEGEGCAAKWPCLQSLWVIDLNYTNWVEMLSEEKIGLMENLMVLNIKGVRWPKWWTSHALQKRLPQLRQLKIVRPMHDEAEKISTGTMHPFLVENTSLEVLDMSGCDGLQEVVLSNNISLQSFSFDGYGSTSHQASATKEPLEVSHLKDLPEVDKKGVVKTCIISLEGCKRLVNLFLRGLPNLEELDLSGCAMIKVLDLEAMLVDAPRLKRLFLLGCERLHAIKWGSSYKSLELICIDTRPGTRSRRPSSLGTQQESFHRQVYAVITDARIARSLWSSIYRGMIDGGCCFSISITSLAACSDSIVRPESAASKEMVIGSNDQRRGCKFDAANMYDDVFTKDSNGLALMWAFPQGPTGQLNRHIEIGDGSHSVQSEVEGIETYHFASLASLMTRYVQSLHVHDVSTYSNIMPVGIWVYLTWCRVERCPNLHTVFPPGAEEITGTLETFWASDLMMAHCIWSKSRIYEFGHRFKSLQHLHLRRCPSLKFALAMGFEPFFPSLRTLHIIHCGSLRHVFVPGDEVYRHPSVQFQKLTNIHLHDLPALEHICEAAEMLAPAVETIRIKGCWSLRRLPALKGREPGMRRPVVEMEKDVWDMLEWDGVAAGHHPSLYEAPVHSRCYMRRRTLRGTVLR